MQTSRKWFAVLMFIMIGSVSSGLLSAQTTTLDETCPPFVSEALNKLDATCQGLGRNSLCYGHNLVTIQFTQAFAQGVFSQPADQTELKNVEYIQTAPLDETLNQWGLALMNVQANVPGTLPGQGVVFILMGNAEMQNKVDSSDTANTMSPMQAFQFTGGIGTPGCKSAQGSLVIQGPDNVVVDLEANGAKIRLASTILLTQRENKFSITTLSGAAKVDEVIVPAGFTTITELDEDNVVVEFAEAEPVDLQEDETFDLYQEIAPDTLNYEIDFTEFEDEWDEAYTEYEDNGGEFEDSYPCLDDPESDECAIYTDETTSEDTSDDTPADDSSGDDNSADDGSADDGGGDTGDDGSTDDGNADSGGDDGSSDNGGDTGGGDDGSADDNGGDDGSGDTGGGDDSGGNDGSTDDSGDTGGGSETP